MKRILLAAVIGLLSGGAAARGFAAVTSAVPPVSTPGPNGGNSAGAPNGVVILPAGSPASHSAADYLPKLQQFYATGAALYNQSTSDKLTEKEINARFDAFITWANQTGQWMNGAMGAAAVTKFTTWRAEVGEDHKLSGHPAQEARNKYATLNIVLPQLLENLRTLMAPDATGQR